LQQSLPAPEKSNTMTLQIVQISDTHITDDVPQRMNDLENCVHTINGLSEPPELVIHTGDITHNGTAPEYHRARQLLDQLDAPYFVMPGNRDKRPELINEFADERYDLPAQGWVQYSVELSGQKLLMVDTLCETSNKGQLCTGRLHHLEAMLSEEPDKPTWLFLHHPPYKAVGIPDPFQYKDWSDVEKLKALLSKYKNVKGMYCGHVHRFIDGEIGDIKASALSCLAGDLRKGEVTDDERKLPVYKTLNLSA